MSDGFYANPPQITQAGDQPAEIAQSCSAISEGLIQTAGAFAPDWGKDPVGTTFTAQVTGVLQAVTGVLGGTAATMEDTGDNLKTTGALYGNSDQVNTGLAGGLTGGLDHLG